MTRAYFLVDGENIDTTLGNSLLGRRPDPEERPRWDKVHNFCTKLAGEDFRALFFLNASSGQVPMSFVNALLSMHWCPIALSGQAEQKVVDLGIQKTLDAILELEDAQVILVSHDVDFIKQIRALLHKKYRVSVLCFKEFLSTQLGALQAEGLQIFDLEYDADAFNTPLPRLQIIAVEDFEPRHYL